MSESYSAQSRIRGDDAVYVRSPLTAAEETTQLFSGSRFLNTTEFKQVYLGHCEGETAGTASSPAQWHTSPRSAQRGASVMSHQFDMTAADNGHSDRNGYANVAPSSSVYNTGFVPPRPPPAAVFPYARKGRAARRLCYMGSEGDERMVAALPSSSAPRTRSPQAASSAAATHSSLSQQLRRKVRAARRTPLTTAETFNAATTAPVASATTTAAAAAADAAAAVGSLSDRGLRSEDAWLAVQRELQEKKEEVQSLQQQLRHTQVLVRALHGVASDDDDDDDHDDDNLDDDDAEAQRKKRAAAPSNEGDDKTLAKDDGKEGVPGKSSSAAVTRPKEYWRRRAYFLERQNEELTVEVEQLRRDARGSKARALMKELKVVRGQLKRYRRQQRPASASARKLNAVMTGGDATPRRTAESDMGDDGSDTEDAAAGLVTQRPSRERDPAASSPTATDELFLRQKDDQIRDLRDRLRLLTQQYQKADTQVITSARQLDDLTHRYNAMQAEWRALQRLPQELARVQQQLDTTQAQLLDADREVEAFHQLFDTLESPATLRAVIDERDHLVELLRQSQQQHAGLRDEMKASQQQALLAVEARYRAQRDEEHAMARDREAQQEQSIRILRKQVETLERQLEAQREAYEAELSENAIEREADLTERLLESVARGGDGDGDGGGGAVTEVVDSPLASEQGVNALCNLPHSASLSSRPPSRDGPRNAPAPRRTPGDDRGAADTAADLLRRTSPLLGTQSSAHESVDALVQHQDHDSASFSSLSPATKDDVTSPPAMEEMTHETSDISSLTPTSSDAASLTDDTLSDTDKAGGEAAQVTTTPEASPTAALTAPFSAVGSREVSVAVAPPSSAPAHDDRAQASSGGDGAAVSARQSVMGDAEVEEEEEVLSESEDGVALPSHSHSTRISGDSSSSSSSSSTQDEGHGLEETVEKMEGHASDSSDESATPPRVPSEMRIGLREAKPHDTAASAAASGAAVSSVPDRRGRLFDFPESPIATVHPVSILINRASMGGLSFADDLRVVVHSPVASPQQSATTVSDPMQSQSQPTLTECNSASAEDNSRADDAGAAASSSSSSPSSSSSSSSSSNSDSASVSASASLSSSSLVHPQSAPQGATEAAAVIAAKASKTQATKKEVTAIALDNASANGKAARAATQSGVRSIQSGSQSVLDDSLELVPHISGTDSPPLARPTQLTASALSSAAAAQSHPLIHTTVHTPTRAPMLSPQSSVMNSPGAMSNKAASIPSPPAVTQLMNSGLYPPRTSSSHLLPTLVLDEGAADAALPRGGVSPRLQSCDHSSFDLTHQFSGNASFDFVGPLAERHRLEDMQNNIVLSQHTSPATLAGSAGGVAAGAAFPSAAPPLSTVRAPLGTGATGLRKTPSPPFLPDARQQSSTVSSSTPRSRPQSAVVADGRALPENPAGKEGESAAGAETNAPAAPVLAAAATRNLAAATSSANEAAGLTVEGPSQPEKQTSASLTTDRDDGNGDEKGITSAAPLGRLASSPSSNGIEGTVSPSPIPNASPPEPTLSSFVAGDVTKNAGEVADRPQDDENEGPHSSRSGSGTTTASKPVDTKRPSGAAPAPASLLLPLPPMVKVPTPPSAALPPPPPPQVPVPSPTPPANSPADTAPPASSQSSPLPPHESGAEEESSDNKRGAAAVARQADDALSISSTVEDAHTLSAAEAPEESEYEDSLFSMPPMVAGGTVEKKLTPSEAHLSANFSLLGPHYAPPSQPRYSISAASSMLGERAN
ncbi:flagellum transition zone component [Lotmaria passim]